MASYKFRHGDYRRCNFFLQVILGLTVATVDDRLRVRCRVILRQVARVCRFSRVLYRGSKERLEGK